MLRYALLIFSMVFMHCCIAQFAFNGRIVNDKSHPLHGAIISINNKAVALADSAGYFSFKHVSKEFLLTITHVGYSAYRLKVNNDLPPIITLSTSNELLQEAIVQAFEKNSGAKDAAVSVSVLNKAALDRYAGLSLVSAISTVAGVKMDERSPGSYRLSIRGNLLRSTFGVRNVKLYWNGIPFTDASGNTYFNLLPSKILDKVEIIKGPAGSMYGSGTGGVVLLNSGTHAAAPDKSIEVQFSSASYGFLSGNISYDKTGKNNTSITYSHQQTDGYRDHSKMRRDVLHYSGTVVVNEKSKLRANIFLADLNYQTPGGLTTGEMADNPAQSRPAAGAFKSAATQKAAVYLKTFYSGLALETGLSSTWKNTTGIYGSYTDFVNPTIRNYENKYDRGAGGRTVFEFNKEDLKAIIGTEIQSGYFYSAVHGNRAGQKDTMQFQDEVNARQFNLFLQGEALIPGGFLLTGGISYNRFYYGFKRETDPNASKQTSSFDPRFVPRIALLKKVKNTSFYTAISYGYSIPTIDEVHAGNDEFNSSLKSETAVNYEIGIKTELFKNKLWLEATHYLYYLQNTIVSRRDSSGGDYYTNAGKTKQQGTEISLQFLPVHNTASFVRQLRFNSSFTNVLARFKDFQQGTMSFDGNRLTGSVPNIFILGASILSATGIYADVNYNYTDHTPLNDANSFWGTSYQLIFAKLGYHRDLSRHINSHVFVAYEKSLGNPYSLGNDLNAAGNRFFNPSAPQQFIVGVHLKYKLKKQVAAH